MYTKLDMPNYAPSSPAAVDCDSVIVPSVRHAHRTVHFTTATTFVFPLTYGGSALPKDAGPPIGMTMDHSDAYVTDLSKVKHRRSRVRKFQHLERVALLKAAGVSPHDIAGYCTEAITIRTSRANTVRLFKRGLMGDQDDEEDAMVRDTSTTIGQTKRRRMDVPVARNED